MVSLKCSVVLLSVVHGWTDVHSHLPRKTHTQTKKAFFCHNSKQQPPRDTKTIYWELRWHVCIIKCNKKVPEIQFHQLIYCPCTQKQRNKQRHQASLHSGGFHSEFYLPEMQAPSSLYHTYSFTFMQTFRNKSGMKNGDCRCSEFQSIKITISYSVCGVYRVQSRYISSLNHDKSSMR